MIAKDLISDSVPHLTSKDTGITALNWMEIFKLSHLPIINKSKYVGLISESEIYDYDKMEEKVISYKLKLNTDFIYDYQHVYNAISIFAKQNLSALPVLNGKNKYIGLITRNEILKTFAKLTSVDNVGSIIVLELNQRDYMLTEIAQIVESNDAKILSLYVASVGNTSKIEITLKVNKTDIAAIIKTFERYDYSIKASYNNTDKLDDLYDDRFDLFMRYLDV